MAKPRRNCTPEFKAEAVRRIAAQGKSLPEVARKLGLGQSLLIHKPADAVRFVEGGVRPDTPLDLPA